jgi:hypothetical protein
MNRHSKARKSLCLVCLDRLSASGSEIHPGSRIGNLVEEFLIFQYTPRDDRLPNGICSSCKKKLESYARGDFRPTLPEFPDYSLMRHFRNRRGSEETCNCFLCTTYAISSRNGYRSKLKKKTVLNLENLSFFL